MKSKRFGCFLSFFFLMFEKLYFVFSVPKQTVRTLLTMILSIADFDGTGTFKSNEIKKSPMTIIIKDYLKSSINVHHKVSGGS